MSFVQFHPRDAVSSLGTVTPDAAENMRVLKIRVGEDLAFDGRNPYARLFIRTLSPEYGAHVFDVCSKTNWIAAFCPPVGDYQLVATSPFSPTPGTIFTDEYRATHVSVVRSAEEAFRAIYPAFEAWCALGEIPMDKGQ